MNPERNPYISKKLELNTYKARKEKNPYIKEEIPHHSKRDDDQYHKKQEGVELFCPKKEENPYLKKSDGSPSLIEKSYINNSSNEKIIHVDQHRKTMKSTLDVKIADPIITNPEKPSVIEIDRFRLRNIPIHKENPYVNWKFSTIKDIDSNHEAKCIKTATNVDGQNIRIDAFTVTPKPVNNEYLIKLDWKLNEEFIDAVRIEQEGSIESNEDVKDKQTKLDEENNHDNVEKDEQLHVHKRRGSVQKDDLWVSLFETELSENDDKKNSDQTFCAVVGDDSLKKSSNSYNESKEIAAKATPDRLMTPMITAPSPTLCTSNADVVTEKKSPNFNEKVEVLKKQLRLLFEHQKLEKESNQAKETQNSNDQNPSKIIQLSELKENVKPTMEKEKMDQKESDIDQIKLIENKKETAEKNWDATSNLGKVFGSRFIEKGSVGEKKAEQQSSQILQDKTKEKYPAQLNIKFNERIGYDHSITSPTSKLPDDAPTYILVGNRFVREDKVLIDLDVNDRAPNNNLSGNTKSSQMELPLELQGIDYEGWKMQQIVEEYQNSFKSKTNSFQPKVKPSESFLEEFER